MQAGTLIGGKYRLTRQIGSGGMGVVWAAVNESVGREVALKLILKSNDELRRRLLREGRACGKLKQRNIVEMYDVGETADGDPFLVMQLLSGETLGEMLKRVRRLNPPHAARIARDVALALVAAHGASIIHRDLKPANIFFHDETDADGAPIKIVKVLDFGVSKNVSGETLDGLATVAGAPVGSPAYMSPEQAKAQHDLDHRSDLWSLGVVLFEMLAGVRPFQGDSNQLGPQIVFDPIPLVSRYVRIIDPGLVAIVSRCLERDLSARVQSAAELAEMLKAFCETTASAPSSTPSAAVLAAPEPARSLPQPTPSSPDLARSPHAMLDSGRLAAPVFDPGRVMTPSRRAQVPLAPPQLDDDDAATARLDPNMLMKRPVARGAEPPAAPPSRGQHSAPSLGSPGDASAPLFQSAYGKTEPLGAVPPRTIDPALPSGGTERVIGPPPAASWKPPTPADARLDEAPAGGLGGFSGGTIKMTPDYLSQLPAAPFSPAAPPPPPIGATASGAWPAAPTATPQLPGSEHGTTSTTAQLLAPPLDVLPAPQPPVVAPPATLSSRAKGLTFLTLIVAIVVAILVVRRTGSSSGAGPATASSSGAKVSATPTTEVDPPGATSTSGAAAKASADAPPDDSASATPEKPSPQATAAAALPPSKPPTTGGGIIDPWGPKPSPSIHPATPPAKPPAPKPVAKPSKKFSPGSI
ncbi:MAG: protein kinase [Byssovorax sp.]